MMRKMITWQEVKAIAETIYDYNCIKADGSISYLTIPPLENLDILEAAELVYKFL